MIEDVLAEDLLVEVVDLLVRVVEATGALIVFVGAVVAAVRTVSHQVRGRRDEGFTEVRLGLGRWLALGLEFLLAGDILSTAIAPSFEEIGKLAAIAAIRTALNYFLNREIDEERREVAERKVQSGAGDGGQAGDHTGG